ncbi:MAG: ASCH domain-containing protein [Elusimicrobia bacterium]|nr:ASCH domain-containing protein [Elusimicrobiota bacterium]
MTPRARAFWNAYLSRLPPSRRPKKPFVEASYAGNRHCTDHLIALYLEGKKTAGSSLVRDFISNGDPLPNAGNYWIVLDSAGRPRILARTVRTERHPFKDVPKSVALAEGEGDRSLRHWRRVHRKAYAPFLKRWGIADIDEAEVITEHFKLVHLADGL